MTPLYQQFRPREWSEVVGQDKAVRELTALRDRSGFSGQCFWIAGASGTGKSTIAALITAEIADPFNVEELDAGAITPAYLREIERTWLTYGMGVKSGRAWIVNEAHALRQDAVKQLLVMLERVPAHCVWVFTTTVDNQNAVIADWLDGPALLSRCKRVDLARRGLAEPFARYVYNCMASIGHNGATIEQLIQVAKRERNNCRAMFQSREMEVGA